jgi:hypothetical protein
MLIGTHTKRTATRNVKSIQYADFEASIVAKTRAALSLCLFLATTLQWAKRPRLNRAESKEWS